MTLEEAKKIKNGDRVYICFTRGVITNYDGTLSEDNPQLPIRCKGFLICTYQTSPHEQSVAFHIKNVFLATEHIKEVSKIVFKERKYLDTIHVNNSFQPSFWQRRIYSKVQEHWRNMCKETNPRLYQEEIMKFYMFMKKLKQSFKTLREITKEHK